VPLWVVATPIGNLADLAPRAREVLGRATVVLCEDTRRTRTLYRSLGIPAPRLVSCYAQNEAARVDEALALLSGGADVALVSDAGTPGLSDPGGRIVEAAHAAGIDVHAVPGPSAIAAALSVSGFNAAPFQFLGFPPRRAGDRRRFVEDAQRWPGTIVLLEAARRLAPLLDDWAALDPDRGAVIARELTKTHEEILRGTLGTISRGPFLGEVVLVLGPRVAEPVAPARELGEGLGDIANALALRWGASRKEAYQALVKLERARSESSS
jgi:16S rRNA (cytidine1402-2'-O)-methyltransferase